MISKNKVIAYLLIFCLISICSISTVSATMYIHGGAFSTNGGDNDLTYASIDVGSAYSGDDIIIQIWYSRDGSILNNGNYVPITVNSNGFVNVKSADAYKYFPDKAEVYIYDTNYGLLDSQEVDLSPSEGIQTFGSGNYDHSYIKGTSSNANSHSSTGSSSSSNSRLNENNPNMGVTNNFFFFQGI